MLRQNDMNVNGCRVKPERRVPARNLSVQREIYYSTEKLQASIHTGTLSVHLPINGFQVRIVRRYARVRRAGFFTRRDFPLHGSKCRAIDEVSQCYVSLKRRARVIVQSAG